jgi:hypothetical protein
VIVFIESAPLKCEYALRRFAQWPRFECTPAATRDNTGRRAARLSVHRFYCNIIMSTLNRESCGGGAHARAQE